MMILLSITIYFSTFFFLLLLFWVILDCIFKQLYVNYKGTKQVRKNIIQI